MNFPYYEITSIFVPFIPAAGAAVATLRAASDSRKALGLAQQSQLDTARQQGTPRLRFWYEPDTVTISTPPESRATLYCEYTGPQPRLDFLSIRIEDSATIGVALPGPDEKYMNERIYGPFQLSRGQDGVDAYGRTCTPYRDVAAWALNTRWALTESDWSRRLPADQKIPRIVITWVAESGSDRWEDRVSVYPAQQGVIR